MTDKLADLKLDQQNPRRHDERNLKIIGESLKATGPARSIVIDEDNNILAGNGVTEAAKAAGIEKVIVIEAEDDALIAVRKRGLTPEQKTALKYYDNRAAELAAWEPEQILADLDAGLDLGQFWSEGELNAILAGLNTEPKQDPRPQVDKATQLAAKWGTQTGQVWRLGEHRLAVGDCTDKAVVEAVMRGERGRFEFSDPPYDLGDIGGGIVGHSAARQAIRDANIDSFSPDELYLISPTALFCCNKLLVPGYINLAKKLNVAWDICFYKKANTPPNYNGHLMTDTEYMMLVGKQHPNPGLEKQFYSKAYIGQPDEDSFVAWAKPINLVIKYLKLYSNISDVIIDRFLGSGTTLIACEQLKRKCRAIEIDPGYCAVTLQRWGDLTGQEPALLG